jgi:ribonuclease P protein subunit POP4
MSKKVIFENYAEELVHKELIPPGQNPTLQYESKVKGKVLLLEDSIPDFQAKKQKKTEQKIRKKKKTMNRKERKRLGLHEVPEEARNWEFFVPLHKLWCSYMKDLIADSNNEIMIYGKLLKADLHGAILTVVQSKCPSNVGISGIVAKDTESTFCMITKDNAMRGLWYLPSDTQTEQCLYVSGE